MRTLLSRKTSRFLKLSKKGLTSRGGKRDGAREHCSKKEMDKTSLGRRIRAKLTALVLIFKKRAILPLILNIKVLIKCIFIYKEHISKYRKIPSSEGYKNNDLLHIPFPFTR